MLTILRTILVGCVFLFTVVPVRGEDGDEHLFMGNPSGATAYATNRDDYLVKKRQYSLSYNNAKGTPNWVSWHLSKTWLGKTHRVNPFAPDTSLPNGFFVVRPNDYRETGFDRGHMCPAGDRCVSREDEDATFLMTNIVPQAPDLNRITWEKLESYCRDQVRDRDKDLYIVAGPAGRGGFAIDGKRETLRGSKGQIVVPSKCWKVVLSLPSGTNDPSKVTTADARVFAVIMPNQQGLATDWRSFAVTVKEVEKLTGYTFFGKLPRDVADDLRSREPETRAKSATAAKDDKPIEKGGATGQLTAFEKGCVIGNKRSKKYHVPGSSGYEMAKESKNAVFFRTAKDAEKEGYTEAKR